MVGNARVEPVIKGSAGIMKRFNTAALGAASVAHTAPTAEVDLAADVNVQPVDGACARARPQAVGFTGSAECFDAATTGRVRRPAERAVGELTRDDLFGYQPCQHAGGQVLGLVGGGIRIAELLETVAHDWAA